MPGRSGRLPAVDAARGAALVSMFIAHVAPVPGPGHILELSEYLTAPWFALLVGAGIALTGRPGWPGRGTALVRALYLAGVGLVLAQAGAQVLIVLGHLAALTVVLVALAPLRSGALLLVAGVTYAVAPFLQDRLHAGGEVALFVAGGYPYRPWAMNIETRAAPRGCAPGRGPEPPPTSWSWGCWAWC